VLSLADKFPVEIINADSMQFYRHMDIGTAKPTEEERGIVPHHLFSILDLDEDFNAASFMRLGRNLIDDISSRNHLPVVVGGTGLYIRALIRGISGAPEGNETLRQQLRLRGREVLYRELSAVDPDTAGRISPNDSIRIIRALEVFYLTGIPLSEHHRRHSFQDDVYRCLKICLTRQRQDLYRRIERRVDSMMDQGLLEEVRALAEKGYPLEAKPFKSIGYRQMIDYIRGNIGLQEAVSEIKTQTRRLAKRQLTWFRRDQELVWVKIPEQAEQVEVLIKKFLNII